MPMEQIGKYYWGMWGASRSSLRSSWPPSPAPAPAAHGGGGEEPAPSWEEQAFARDTAGHLGLGGCVWPPRSYTCSFCRREFRSAQALGGHMNVHRRDRARLRQCASPDPDHDAAVLQSRTSASAVLLSSPKSTHKLDEISSSSYAYAPGAGPPSYLPAIIKEMESISSMPAAATAIEEEEDDQRSKRRRIQLHPPATATATATAMMLPFYVRPSAASCEREGKGLAGDAKVGVLPKVIVIANPSSSSSTNSRLNLDLVARQEIDLELRLGSSPKAVS